MKKVTDIDEYYLLSNSIKLNLCNALRKISFVYIYIRDVFIFGLPFIHIFGFRVSVDFSLVDFGKNNISTRINKIIVTMV